MWARWANGIAGHPLLAGLAALAILIPLSIPLFSLTLGQQDIAAYPESTTARRAYDLISEYFGPGVNGPLLIAVSLATPAQPGASGASSGSPPQASTSAQNDPRVTDPRLTTLQKNIASTDGVEAVSPVRLDQPGTSAYFNAIPTTGPAEPATATLVNTLRSHAIPDAEKGTNMQAYIGGSTAANVDLAAKISSKLPLQIVVVIALSLILLLLAFRTIVVPPQAAVMNLLSIAASYGVLTAIFQYGWLSGLIGLSGPVPIVSYVPLFMFAGLFGLSMDYQVFLVSQIEEHVHAGEDNKSSVVSGLVTSARVITAAASIMVFVFGSFVLNGNPTIKQFGVGLAVAVILDATVVRCLFVPAVMILTGDANWYIPKWLDRILPHVSIEGAEFFDVTNGAPGSPEPVSVGASSAED
jgi:RND superfamily putative drug exporter